MVSPVPPLPGDEECAHGRTELPRVEAAELPSPEAVVVPRAEHSAHDGPCRAVHTEGRLPRKCGREFQSWSLGRRGEQSEVEGGRTLNTETSRACWNTCPMCQIGVRRVYSHREDGNECGTRQSALNDAKHLQCSWWFYLTVYVLEATFTVGLPSVLLNSNVQKESYFLIGLWSVVSGRLTPKLLT